MDQKIRRPGGRIKDEKVYGDIKERIWLGDKVAEIMRTYPDCDGVSRSTVKRMVKTYGDNSEPWSFGAGSPAEREVLLPVAQWVVGESMGRAVLTRAVAAWIMQLHKAGVNDCGIPLLYALARAYRERRASDQSTDDLDAFIAYAPWRDETRYATFWMTTLSGRPATGDIARLLFLSRTLNVSLDSLLAKEADNG